MIPFTRNVICELRSENPDGYDDNSPLFHAADLSGDLLIIHGSADDNVHAQNTYEFTEKMVQAGKQFDMAIYTNRAHGISGGNTTMHLYNKMTPLFGRRTKINVLCFINQ